MNRHLRLSASWSPSAMTGRPFAYKGRRIERVTRPRRADRKASRRAGVIERQPPRVTARQTPALILGRCWAGWPLRDCQRKLRQGD